MPRLYRVCFHSLIHIVGLYLKENVERLDHENVHPAVEIKQMKPAAAAAASDPASDPVVVVVGANEEIQPDDIITSEQEGGGIKENTNALFETGAGQQEGTGGGEGQSAATTASLKEASAMNEKAMFGLVSSTLLPPAVHIKSSKPAKNSIACTTATGSTTLGSLDVLNPWFLSGGAPNFRPTSRASQAGNKDGEIWMELQSSSAASSGGRHGQTTQLNATAADGDYTTASSTVQNAIKSEKDASHRFDSKLLQALLHNS